MQEAFKIVVNNEEDGLWLVHEGEPRICVSPVNKAGWRKVSVCLVGPDETAMIGKGLLKDVEEYLTKEHHMKQNNDIKWRWKRTTIGHPSEGIAMHEANVRQHQLVPVGDEEE